MKGASWPLQEAKNRLSEVVERSLQDGPQTITRRGTPVAVLVSVAEFEARTKPATSLVRFLRASPLAGAGLDLERDERDTGREIDLGVAR